MLSWINVENEMSPWFLTAQIEQVTGTVKTKSNYMKEEN